MIPALYEALKLANVSSEVAERAVSEIEFLIREKNSDVSYAIKDLYTEKIVPLEKETDGIRSEIRLLNETIKIGFQSVERQFQSVERQFQSVEKQFQSVEKQFQSVEKQFQSAEKVNEARFHSIEKRLELLIKLNWTVIGFVVAGYAFFGSMLWKLLEK